MLELRLTDHPVHQPKALNEPMQSNGQDQSDRTAMNLGDPLSLMINPKIVAPESAMLLPVNTVPRRVSG